MDTPLPGLSLAACFFVIFFFAITFYLSTCIKIVPEQQRLEVYRLGRYVGRRGPGLVVVIPIIDRAFKVDVASPEQAMARVAAVTTGMAHGKALTSIQEEGEVEVDGRIWYATSTEPIPAGAQVRVRRVILEVEKIP
jgi:regulator of protease activity HflC (stomatin/prohibitin superfamily)